jgi:broad specificity phosphatase PhoE
MSDMACTVEVVIVQHADKQRRPGDPGLSPLGHQQATLTARWITANLELAALWSSPLRRATETAAPISRTTGRPATIDDRLRERMNWDNPSAQSLQQFLDEWTDATLDRDLVPLSGDSSNAAANRFLDFLDELARSERPGTHAVVTHGGVTVDLLRTLAGDDALDAAAPGLIETGIPSCALTRLSHHNEWAITSMAWTDHLITLGS